MDYKSLIYRALEGNASPSELKRLEDWMASKDLNLVEFQNIKTLWENRIAPNTFEQNESLQILAKIKHQIHLRYARKKKTRRVATLLTFTSGICLCLVLMWMTMNKPNKLPYLKFDNTSLRQVVSTLDEKWNIHVEVENKEALECEFTGTFYNRPVEGVVRVIAIRLGLVVKVKNNNRFKLIGRGCA